MSRCQNKHTPPPPPKKPWRKSFWCFHPSIRRAIRRQWLFLPAVLSFSYLINFPPNYMSISHQCNTTSDALSLFHIVCRQQRGKINSFVTKGAGAAFLRAIQNAHMCTSCWIMHVETSRPSPWFLQERSSEKSTCRLQSTRIVVIHFLFVCIYFDGGVRERTSKWNVIKYICFFPNSGGRLALAKSASSVLHLGVISPTHHWNECGSKLYCGAQWAQKQVYWWFLYLKSGRKCALVCQSKKFFLCSALMEKGLIHMKSECCCNKYCTLNLSSL